MPGRVTREPLRTRRGGVVPPNLVSISGANARRALFETAHLSEGRLDLQRRWHSIQTTTGEHMTLYCEQQTKNTNRPNPRWWLYTISRPSDISLHVNGHIRAWQGGQPTLRVDNDA